MVDWYTVFYYDEKMENILSQVRVPALSEQDACDLGYVHFQNHLEHPVFIARIEAYKE